MALAHASQKWNVRSLATSGLDAVVRWTAAGSFLQASQSIGEI